MPDISRRTLLHGVVAAAAAGAATRLPAGTDLVAGKAPVDEPLKLKFSLKFGMCRVRAPIKERFQLLKDIGYDGVELDSPNKFDTKEVLEAVAATGLPVEGIVDSIHWKIRLSDPDPAVRNEGRAGLETAITDCKAYGGSSVLLVPGRVANQDTENQEQCWERSITEIRKVLPLCAEHGIHVLIENVWNGFCYEHNGPADQSADQLAAYIDAIDSPWVGVHFDIGNHQKYGKPADWARTLGRRIVKLDVKDWGVENNFCKIGDGDVDWGAVRTALTEIGYTGWAAAEVGGGGPDRLADILARMKKELTPA